LATYSNYRNLFQSNINEQSRLKLILRIKNLSKTKIASHPSISRPLRPQLLAEAFYQHFSRYQAKVLLE